VGIGSLLFFEVKGDVPAAIFVSMANTGLILFNSVKDAEDQGLQHLGILKCGISKNVILP
jgi:hypothetical protein